MGEDQAVRHRSRHGVLQQPPARGRRLLQQEVGRPALRRLAARYVGIRLGHAERRFDPLLRARIRNFVGERQHQELQLDDRLHLLVQRQQGAVAARRVLL